jgi:hypothetical protein
MFGLRTIMRKIWQFIQDEEQQNDYDKFVDRLKQDRERTHSWMHDGDRR